MSTQSGPLAQTELSAVTSSLPLPCPITMTITDKNIYYVGSPLPVPPNISQGSGSSLSPSKSLIQLTEREKKPHPLLALMLSFITPMKGEPEHEGVSSPLLPFFPRNSPYPTFNFHFSFLTHFRKKRGKAKKEGGRVSK